jgi:TolA-binding protein
MAKANKRTQDKNTNAEAFENPEILADKVTKVEDYIEKNRKWVFIIGGTIAVVVIGFFLYQYYTENQNEIAQREMFQAQFYFESDSLGLALNGDSRGNYGFLEIIDDYPMTEAANLSHYYAGVSFLKLGQFDQAIEHLEKFKSDDYVVQARAYALVGDAFMEQENYDKAANHYDRAASYKPNEHFTPDYLIKEALAHEKSDDLQSAIESYKTIVEEYPQSRRIQEAKKQLNRLQVLAAK